ncbi:MULTISPECIES: DMT family transporter [unclassified Acinetobacter]|uniref:DMT family transporter n=1 Tax=unclassified Acinetobacter TaxID=196816 RepID=UPI002934C1E9|nr:MULTISPECIES: DMT family transporter [unclassified Acinetobacter]WOE30597.1 DMT family transporter [Acinetobacter sp. SAAs470]WOE38789.1 DMT family transporter [Acinetobacter sp. SAAs474]
MEKKYLFLLLLLGVLQGAAFLFIKIAVSFLNPFNVVFLRIILALPCIYLFVFYRYSDIFSVVKAHFPILLLLSLSSVIIPFLLIAWAGQYIASGVASIYMALIPIFVSIFEVIFRKNIGFSLRAYLGLFLGFIGVILLFINDLLSNFSHGLWGHVACFVAAICYAFSIYKSKALSVLAPALIGCGVLSLASLLLLPMLSLMPLPKLIWTAPWWSILGLAFISTAGALILMYYLIDQIGTVFTATTNYLVPLVGIFLGFIFLHERLSNMLVPAVSLILVGLYCVSTGKKQHRDLLDDT